METNEEIRAKLLEGAHSTASKIRITKVLAACDAYEEHTSQLAHERNVKHKENQKLRKELRACEDKIAALEGIALDMLKDFYMQVNIDSNDWALFEPYPERLREVGVDV